MSLFNRLFRRNSSSGDNVALQQRVNALEGEVGQLRNNGFADFYAGFGDETRDVLERLEFKPGGRLTRRTLEDLYEFSGLAANVVDFPIDDATRKGVDLLAGKSHLDDVERYLEALPFKVGIHGRQTGAMLAINRGGKLGRLLGEGVVVANIRDGRLPWEPLDEGNIEVVEKLHVHHAHELWPHEYSTDGTCQVYRLSPDPDGSTGVQNKHHLLHASRLFTLPGVELTPQRQARRMGYGAPVLQRVIRSLLRNDFVADQAARTTARKNIPVFRTEGLKEQVAKDNGKSLHKRLMIILKGMSILRMIPLDKGDDITHLDASLAGLADLLDRNPYRVSADSGIPMTRLFGMSPGGMNATGEHDLDNYYDMVAGSIQAPHIVPCYTWLARLVMLSHQGPTNGQIPDDFHAKARPLKEQSEKEKADTEHIRAKTAQIWLKERVASREVIAEQHGFEAPALTPVEPSGQGGKDDEVEAERLNAAQGQVAAVRLNGMKGDGSRLAVMIPARHLGEHYPDLKEPHVTLVYLPDTGGRTEQAMTIIREVIAEHDQPFRCELGGLDHLFSPDGQLVFYQRVRASNWAHEELRCKLVEALQASGIPVAWPDRWVPHLTLSIENDPRADWTGVVASSSWWVNELEVWGMDEVAVLPVETPFR